MNLFVMIAHRHLLGLINIDHMGNTSSGTLALCLWEYEPLLKKGDRLVFTAFGAGFSWGASYMIWGYDGAAEAAKSPAQFYKEGLMTSFSIQSMAAYAFFAS